MTTLQKAVITVLVVAVGTAIYEARQAANARAEVQMLQQQQVPLTEQIQQAQRDREEALRQLASLRETNGRLNRDTGELLRLRAEVGALRSTIQTPEQTETEPALTAWQSLLAKADLIQQDPKMEEARPLLQASIVFRLYAAEHDGAFPSALSQLEPFVSPEETNMLVQWEAQLEIVPGEHTTNSPSDSVIARAKNRDAFGRRWSVCADGSIQLKGDEP